MISKHVWDRRATGWVLEPQLGEEVVHGCMWRAAQHQVSESEEGRKVICGGEEPTWGIKPELGEGHLDKPAQVSEPRQGGEKRVHAGSRQQWRGETGYSDREVDQINTSDRKDWGNLISHHQSKELQIWKEKKLEQALWFWTGIGATNGNHGIRRIVINTETNKDPNVYTHT